MMNKQHTDELTTEELQLIALMRSNQWMELIMLAAANIPPVEPSQPTAEELAAAEAAKQQRIEAVQAHMQQHEQQRREEHSRIAWAIYGALVGAFILDEPGREYGDQSHTLAQGVILDTLNQYANW